MTYTFDLTAVWALIIAFAVFAYIVMDGFDLGIGILFPPFRVGEERDHAMNSIAPVWDGNETWLVLGGGGLLAAFPLAYAIILPATYPLMIAMLLGLVFRGVAFEFRWRHAGHRPLWDAAFTIGSLVAALAQGITLGAILQGIPVENNAYAGGWLDWLSPFSVLHWRLAGDRLRAARGELAHLEDGRRNAASGPSPRVRAWDWDSGGNGSRERGHAFPPLRLLAALVRDAGCAGDGAGATARADLGGGVLLEPAARRRASAVPARSCPLPARLHRPRYQHVSLCCAASRDHLGRCRAGLAQRSSSR